MQDRGGRKTPSCEVVRTAGMGSDCVEWFRNSKLSRPRWLYSLTHRAVWNVWVAEDQRYCNLKIQGAYYDKQTPEQPHTWKPNVSCMILLCT